MKKHKVLFLLLLLIIVFSCSNTSEKLADNNLKKEEVISIPKKIQVTISNIPKIKHKVSTGLNSYKIDKRPTLTYLLFNDAKDYEMPFDSITNSLEKEFDKDTVFLKLRYNPGKSQLFILRRGDSATINYINEKPFLEVKNRTFKKHDLDVVEAVNKFDTGDNHFKFLLNPLVKRGKNREKLKIIKAYDKILVTLDSLSQNDFISDAEFYYYKKTYTYKIATTKNKFNVNELKNTDLHLQAYTHYLRQYVFKNLKKKIVSLGNGMSRNFLESFDFVHSNEHFSRKNKKILLTSSLRNIKTDYPKSVYQNRLKKYNQLFPEEIIQKEKQKSLPDVQQELKDVLLVNSENNSFTLTEILKQHKGKLVYIDFWASWCAPCRAAFPSYAALKKEYNNKEIVFIFISGDKDETKWKKAETEEKLTNSYWAINYPEAEFYTKLNLMSFPRYVLFNKNGILINDKAKAPDSDLIRGFLDELITN